MKRRDFVVALGGTVALPLIPQVQGAEAVRRVGVLLPATINDPEWKARSDAFLEALAQLGWVVDRNVQIETRWGTPNSAELRRHAAELAALAPDVILAGGTSTVGPLLQAASAVPIIFAVVNDPVGAGFVESLARPSGNATGLMTFEYSLAGKWLDLLKQIAPGVTRVAVLRDASQGSATSMFAAIQALASSLRVDVIPINMRDAGEIERAVENFAQTPNGGLIPTASAAAVRYRDLIVGLVAQHRLPAVYWERLFVTAGGLMSYGPDLVDQFRQAASYVHRVLNGEKPADLPVQAPNKYQMVLNLKTAIALGLTVPQTLLARADEVIE